MKTIARPNPLVNYMRQPKIYIKLPTNGVYWPPKSLEMTETGEFPVYSMTARDELIFKTPDALLNGQGIVDVIQSCMPNIKNAWACPTLDLDSILMALRLATYGERMTIKYKVPVIDEEVEFDLDIRHLMDQQLVNVGWEEEIKISAEISIFVRPLTYKHMTNVSLKSFETQRILNTVNDDTLSEEQKLSLFNSSFANLTQITVDLISESIFKVVTPDGEVSDPTFIKDFISNSDKDLFNTIKDHLDRLKTNNEIKPITINTTEEQREAGAPETYDIPVNFNNSDFFV